MLLGVPYLLPLLLLILAIATLFGSCLVGIDRLAFRDVSHFYTPLYGYLAKRERVDWLPLYNDLDHVGIPLAGETTTALFYPVRRIVFRLVDSPESAIAWYVASHLLLAGITAAWAARKAGATREGASIAMIAYPLSGPIWFLYTNPPFLVGAAWLPLALGGGFALLRSCRVSDVVVTSSALAMMILAGDPQTAVHIVLIGALAWMTKTAFSVLSSCRTSATDSVLRSLGSLTRLATALVFATFLAAPQIAASIDWAPQSVRYVAQEISSRHDIFAFSVAPWHWAELIVPYISGSLFPQYARISHLLPGDGRTWAITLYCGLITVALALLRYRILFIPQFLDRFSSKRRSEKGSKPERTPRRRARWRRFDGWDCIAPIGLAFAMGNLSIGALIRWVQPQFLLGIDDLMLSPYGWLVAWMPGYDGFRYPAKWLVFVPLGIVVAAARQAGHLTEAVTVAASRIAIVLAMISFMVAASVVLGLNGMLAWLPDRIQRSDSIWGPIDFGTAGWLVATSTLAVVCFAKLFDTVPRLGLDRKTSFHCLLFLVTIDLWIVARPTFATVDRNRELQLIESAGSHFMNLASDDRPAGLPMRAMRLSVRGWPSGLRNATALGNQRVLIAEASMRKSLFGRWHLADQVAVFNSPTSLPPARFRSFWSAANSRSRTLPTDERNRYWTSIMQWLAIDQSWVVQDIIGGSSTDATELPITSLTQTSIDQPSPMVTWHSDWREIDATSSVSPEAFNRRIQEIVSGGVSAEVPWFETSNQMPKQVRTTAPPPLTSAESVSNATGSMSVVYPKPGNWKIVVDAPSDGLICVRQFQDGNLRAIIRPVEQSGTSNATPVNVHRCDYLFSGVKVPAGRHEVQIVYSPRWTTPSLVIALGCWAAVLLALLCLVRSDHIHVARRVSRIIRTFVNRVVTARTGLQT
ncbi:MAG TPA: hypothetical protein DDZ51_00870 [Planctomycetaceae bacterium]|nr:hypothetical protein [Planctomycetaceae bacterium]